MATVEYGASATRVGLAGEFAASLGRVERAVKRRLAQILAEEESSVEAWRALCLLADGEGHPMTQVADSALLPGPSVTRLVDRLVEDNLVYRRVDERDRRRVLVCATERGLSLQQRLSERIERERKAILAGASTRDVKRIIALLDGLA